MAQVTLHNVDKVFPGGVQAVEHLELAITDGEFMVLVGPSGCGKTTTLRMIAGLESVSSGTIKIGQRVVNDLPPKDRDVAMVFQNYALYPHMTVYDNMAFSLKLRRRALGLTRAKIDRTVRHAAATLGIVDLLPRRPRALSGGQRQRVAVGRAIVRDPQVFLFDEPLSNLDARLRGQMRAELKGLHRRLGTTTIYVTHDQEEAMTLGDRVAVMKAGVVHQCGAPLDVYERPLDRFVAGFVGSPPMSFLPGHVRHGSGGLVFDEGNGQVPLPARMAERLAGQVDRPTVLGVRPEAIGFSAEGVWPWPRCPACGAEARGRYCHSCGARQHSDARKGVPEPHLTGRVSVVEPLGDTMDVFVSTASDKALVARVDARSRIVEGQELPMFIDMRGAHVFEPGEAGSNLTLSGNGVAGRGN